MFLVRLNIFNKPPSKQSPWMYTGLTVDFVDFAKVFPSSLVFFCIELEAVLLGMLHEVLNESPVLMLITTSDAGDTISVSFENF